MDHRIRVALGMSKPDQFTGHVEADETFVGGLARNMHKACVRAGSRHRRQDKTR